MTPELIRDNVQTAMPTIVIKVQCQGARPDWQTSADSLRVTAELIALDRAVFAREFNAGANKITIHIDPDTTQTENETRSRTVPDNLPLHL